jgi:hypothetical protein
MWYTKTSVQQYFPSTREHGRHDSAEFVVRSASFKYFLVTLCTVPATARACCLPVACLQFGTKHAGCWLCDTGLLWSSLICTDTVIMSLVVVSVVKLCV